MHSPSSRPTVSQQDRPDAELLWRYHRLGHELRRCAAAIGLGSHDLGVATYAAQLYLRGLFPLIVFTGGTSPTTRNRFANITKSRSVLEAAAHHQTASC
jgi:hypothetical protein